MQRSIFNSVLKAQLVKQRDNFILWSPVAFGMGIWFYFQLLNEPPLWVGGGIIACISFLMLMIRFRIQYIDKYIIVYIMLMGFGFTASQFKTHIVASPVIENSKSLKNITGRVMRLEQRPKGPRVWLDNVSIENIAPSNTPERIRLTFGRNVKLNIADEISVRARLRPPPPPSIAGSYDFQRRAWFEKLGAVGFSLGKPTILYEGAVAGQPFSLQLTEIRKKITDIISAVLPAKISGVTTALIVGDRSAITEKTQTIMRDAGLAHLLAISGLHMGLVATVLFFSLRALLALSERLTLHYHIKKWAAWGALPGSLAYLLIAGAPLPTQRAFIMTALVLLAVICDRVALSMRLVAIAALVVLLLFPESLYSPSFQMSFAAVVGLVALFDSKLSRGLKTSLNGSFKTRLLGYVLGLSASTLIATLATMPFAIYHFGRIADYGLVANLLAVPIMAFWVMPWAVVSMILMPFGLGFIGLVPMGWGVEAILEIASMVASWPGSYQMVANIPDMALGGFVIAGLWVCLWRGRVRMLGAPIALGALIIALTTDKPDIIVSRDGRLIAIQSQQGELMLSNLRRNRFEADIWQRRLGIEAVLPWPDVMSGPMMGLSCDALGCLYQKNNLKIAFPKSQLALSEDCLYADIIISIKFPINEDFCKSPAAIIDRWNLRNEGGHLIYLDNYHIETVEGARGKRLWTGEISK